MLDFPLNHQFSECECSANGHAIDDGPVSPFSRGKASCEEPSKKAGHWDAPAERGHPVECCGLRDRSGPNASAYSDENRGWRVHRGNLPNSSGESIA